LRERYESLDPFVLKAEVERRLKPILAEAVEIGRRAAGGSSPVGGLTPKVNSKANTETRVINACLLRLLRCHLSVRQRARGHITAEAPAGVN